ncbi:hypothetical protein QT397_02125 (plasmid) [Microbulbifer sp. MKSA007]|nr:hypothetical protein QT397_02125 [Microbulbifer sp. MKSA007]
MLEGADLARQLSERFYESGAGRVLSTAFEQFLSVQVLAQLLRCLDL